MANFFGAKITFSFFFKEKDRSWLFARRRKLCGDLNARNLNRRRLERTEPNLRHFIWQIATSLKKDFFKLKKKQKTKQNKKQNKKTKNNNKKIIFFYR